MWAPLAVAAGKLAAVPGRGQGGDPGLASTSPALPFFPLLCPAATDGPGSTLGCTGSSVPPPRVAVLTSVGLLSPWRAATPRPRGGPHVPVALGTSWGRPPCLHIPVKCGTSLGRFLHPCEIWNIPGRSPCSHGHAGADPHRRPWQVPIDTPGRSPCPCDTGDVLGKTPCPCQNWDTPCRSP